ncbi:E1 ubiquitin-activating protein [Sarracenia purpurea var. burkii]
MGLCGGFSSLLHFMLHRKRPFVGDVVEDDTNDRESLFKRHRIGCMISPLSTATEKITTNLAVTTNDENKSSDVNSNKSDISNNINHNSDSNVLPDMALGDGNPEKSYFTGDDNLRVRLASGGGGAVAVAV